MASSSLEDNILYRLLKVFRYAGYLIVIYAGLYMVWHVVLEDEGLFAVTVNGLWLVLVTVWALWVVEEVYRAIIKTFFGR